MTNIAVLLTVYNRKDVTLMGLRSLFASIVYLGEGFVFDIYMVDDGCTDGTSEAVSKEFPNVIIVNGNGSLFWGGGMRLAWTMAIKSPHPYDFFLWFNDDSVLYKNALVELFKDFDGSGIVVGAFRDKYGNPSYGGKNDGCLVEPNGSLQEIKYMNGNLVLIPFLIYKEIGMIDKVFKHGEGDYDYGIRVQKKGYRVLLTSIYIGLAERHDEIIPKYCNTDYSLIDRLKILHTPIYSPFSHYIFNSRYFGIWSAIRSLFICYVGALLPSVYIKAKRKISKI